jgi:hypothetical protein
MTVGKVTEVFRRRFVASVVSAGELVSAEGLSVPDQARLVSTGKDGVPIANGVSPESKEFLAGYWIVDVDSPE